MACIRCKSAVKLALCKTCRDTLKYDLEQRLAYMSTGRPYPLLDEVNVSESVMGTKRRFVNPYKTEDDAWLDGIRNLPVRKFPDDVANKVIASLDKQTNEFVTSLVTEAVEELADVHVDGICDDCGEPIPVKRIKLVPDTKLCAPCQTDRGDVFTYRGVGYVTGGQHYGGLVQDIAKNSKDWQKVNVRQLNGKFVDSSSDEEV